jgi:hypothetical protein
VARDILDDGPLGQHCRVVPAIAIADGMAAAVEPVAGKVREVDPADERLPTIENHELLVVTVHRPFATIGRDMKARTVGEVGHHGFDLTPTGPEQRQWCPGPGQKTHLDTAVGRLPEKLREFLAIVPPRELELWAEEPPREFDGALGGPYRGGDARQRSGAIHQYLDPIALTRRERLRSDVRRGRIQGTLPADPPQATAMVPSHRSLDRVS